jgi:hypothetical protein
MNTAERRVIAAAIHRYHNWASAAPEVLAKVLAGSDDIAGGKLGADLIRACAALVKARKK